MAIARGKKFWQRLKLGTKFTLSLSLVFLCGSLLSYIILSQIQTKTAQRTVSEQAIVLMNTLNSLRNYHVTQIRPLMNVETEETDEFIPEMIPSYVVRQIFEQFREQQDFQQYLYKDATLNPTNPRDRADDFETQLVEEFKEDSNLKELEGFRRLDGEPLFYVARPLAVTEAGCLVCHSTPEVAPKNLIRTYGSEGGFGWYLNEIIATQIIYIPARQIFQVARQNTKLAVSLFMVIFALVLFIFNSLLKRAVLKPLQPMSRIAQYLSDENPVTTRSSHTNEFKQLDKIATQGDELGQLARIFQHMAQIVYSREQGLRQQLQDVFEGMQQQEKAEKNTKTYIRELLARARALHQNNTSD